MMCQTHPYRLIDAPFNGIVDAMLGVLAKLKVEFFRNLPTMRVNILFFMPNKNYTLENLTWKPNMEVWKRIFHFSWVICSFHNFRGCVQL